MPNTKLLRQAYIYRRKSCLEKWLVYNYQFTASNLILQLIYDPRLKTKIRLFELPGRSVARQYSANDVTPEFICDLRYVLRDALSLKLHMAADNDEDYSDYSVTET